MFEKNIIFSSHIRFITAECLNCTTLPYKGKIWNIVYSINDSNSTGDYHFSGEINQGISNWKVQLPDGNEKTFTIEVRQGVENNLDVNLDKNEVGANIKEAFIRELSSRRAKNHVPEEKINITIDSEGNVKCEEEPIPFPKNIPQEGRDDIIEGIPVFPYDVGIQSNKDPMLKWMGGDIQEDQTTNESAMFEGMDSCPLRKPYNTVGAKIRNFLFNLLTAIAAFFKGETKFEKNNSMSENINNIIRKNINNILNRETFSVDSTQNITAAESASQEDWDLAEPLISDMSEEANFIISPVPEFEVIDTPRDGNCMLWSAMIVGFDNMSMLDNVKKCCGEVRNVNIPYLRDQIAQDLEGKNATDRARKIRKNVGLGAENIKPNEMGPVAKAFKRDIAIITQNGDQLVGYLCTKEEECTQSQDGSFNKERFNEALKNGQAIYATGGHARALRVKKN